MHRQPKAVGSRVVRGPLVTAVAFVAALVLLAPSVVLGRGPGSPAFPPSIGPDGRDADLPRSGVPWDASAVELAHTARQAVKHGTTEAACTGWRSEYSPPPNIRVYRSRGPAAGTVQVVPFKDYVETVMPAEWPHYWESEAIRVGAIAVKQYGWYFTIVYRGGKDASGDCFDVRDTSTDQNYYPERFSVYPSQRKAVALSWGVTLRKAQPKDGKSKFMLTGYRTGGRGPCGAQADGKLLFQWPIARCANRDRTHEQILRLYLEPRLEIIEPGHHDIVGEERGDASVLVREDGARSARIFEPVDPSGIEPAGGTSPTIEEEGFLGARSSDIDKDGRDDLVVLHSPAAAPAAGGWRISVAESDGAGYSEPDPWANGSAELGPDTTLLAGDLDGNGWGDAAFLAAATDLDPDAQPGTAVLRVLLNESGGPAAPVTWWSGPVDLSNSQAFAGDANGDGRLDLVIAQDLGDGGIEYLVAPSRTKGGPLAALARWFLAPDLRWATTNHVVGDSNRDGRDDLWVATPTGNGIQVSALKAGRTAGFSLIPRWTSAPSDGIAFDGLKMGSADVSFDSMGDLVLFLQDGAGTRLVTLRARYDSMVLGTMQDEPGLDWDKISPY